MQVQTRLAYFLVWFQNTHNNFSEFPKWGLSMQTGIGEQAISEVEIAERAYHLWESRGRPVSDGKDDWEQAEAELLAEASKNLGAESMSAALNESRAESRIESQAGSQTESSTTQPSEPEVTHGKGRGVLSRVVQSFFKKN